MAFKLGIVYKFICTALVLTSVSFGSVAQWSELKGKSKIIHYTKDDFGAETQFWSMAEDDKGIIYFGTNRGISILNGRHWSDLEISNGSDVRAVLATEDNRIIVGGFNEIGEIKIDEYGHFYYESMLDLLSSEEIDFSHIWQIEYYKDLLIFRSFDALIIVSNNKATVLPTDDVFRSVQIVKETIYVVNNNGINRMDPETFELDLFIDSKAFNDEQIIRILPYKDDLALAFSREGNSYFFNVNNGKFIFNQAHFDAENPDQIFCVSEPVNGVYLLGTINNFIKYYNPQIPESEQYRTDIQDKTVLNIHVSKNGNIWTLLNRGVDCIDNSFPGTTLYEDATIYDTEIFNNYLFIATNQGTYVSKNEIDNYPISTDDFDLIKGLEAQSWSVDKVDDYLFIGHDKGAFYLDSNNKPVYIEGTTGIYKIIPINGIDNKYLGCAYDGLYLLENRSGRFRLLNKVKNFDDGTKDIMPGEAFGEYWICHGYKGVFHIKINSDYSEIISREHFTDKNGLPTYLGINVGKYNGEIIFLSDFGPYYYDETSSRFLPHPELQEIFKDNKKVTKIVQHESTVWFVQDNSLGFYSLSRPNELNKNIFKSLDGTFNTNWEHLNPLNSRSLIVGTNAGLFVFKHTSPNTTVEIPTLINEISYINNSDSLIYISTRLGEMPLLLDYDINSLRFRYSAPKLSSKKEVQYQYRLDNFENDWSDWSNNNFKEFSYLKPGEYVFNVRAIDQLNKVSSVARYPFEITPPWYQSKLALFFYVVFAVLLIVVVVYQARKSLKTSLAEEEKIRGLLELELQQVKLEKEKELILKDKQNLESDIINKSKEIANYTILLVKKHDIMSEIRDALNLIKKEVKLDKTKQRIRNLAKKISNNLEDEEHLQVFDTNFERVHQDFFDELKSKYPDLSQKELRLCGFVKMNMSNKEIASILNISVRGVETARYRLRKRLSLDHDINFVEFLDKLSSPSSMSMEDEEDD